MWDLMLFSGCHTRGQRLRKKRQFLLATGYTASCRHVITSDLSPYFLVGHANLQCFILQGILFLFYKDILVIGSGNYISFFMLLHRITIRCLFIVQISIFTIFYNGSPLPGSCCKAIATRSCGF